MRLSIDYAKNRRLWDTPIGDFQLIQLKLAQMEVARVNVRNLVFATSSAPAPGRRRPSPRPRR